MFGCAEFLQLALMERDLPESLVREFMEYNPSGLLAQLVRSFSEQRQTARARFEYCSLF